MYLKGRGPVRLHGFFRSSASWRVRIALNFKGITADHSFYKLRRGDQRSPDFLALNPQGLVPALTLDNGETLTQSLAILEWLEETVPNPPLLPDDPVARARVRAFAMAVACDIHPIQNLKILARVQALGHDESVSNSWARDIITDGFQSLEQMIAEQTGPFCLGDQPTLADVCLVPQFGNARRFGVDLTPFPRLVAAEAAASALPAFADAAPDRQADAE